MLTLYQKGNLELQPIGLLVLATLYHVSCNLQNEELQRSNWQLKDENHKLVVRMMEEGATSPISRHPGDGESGENSVRSAYNSEVGFRRQTNLRQTYHFGKDTALCLT